MVNKLQIGTRIKNLRKARGLTQNELASGIVTRNMLSLIEKGRATPSLDVLCALCDSLGCDVSYVLSDKDTFVFEKAERILKIRQLLSNGSYSLCLDIINSFSDADDEIAYVGAICSYKLGKECVLAGKLKRAIEHFKELDRFAKGTVYPTDTYTNFSKLYIAVAKNIQTPLIEFDTDFFKSSYLYNDEFEFFKYISGDYEFPYTNPLLSRHASARGLIKGRKYKEALEILFEIADNKKKYGYNSHVIFSVYSDIEYVMRELSDFEGAYRYSSKRLSMLSSFNY